MRITIALLTVLTLASCTDTRIEDPVPVGSRDQVFDDVPVIQDFSYDEEGRRTQDGRIRVSRMELRGGLKATGVVDFYKKALVAHHWKLQEERGGDEKPFTLVYTKDKEKLTLVAKQETIKETVVTITIGPK